MLLGRQIKPGLNGLLLGLLPGLEEGAEYFDRWAKEMACANNCFYFFIFFDDNKVMQIF